MANVKKVYGLRGVGLMDASLSNNLIQVDNVNNTENHYGIYLAGSDRNVLQGNNIDLVNNDAKDIGINLDGTSDNNQGGDNITYRCGTGIIDSGTGNAVTGKDV